MSRAYQSSLRKIVGIEDIERDIAVIKQAVGIRGGRGIAWIEEDGKTGVVSGNAPDEDNVSGGTTPGGGGSAGGGTVVDGAGNTVNLPGFGTDADGNPYNPNNNQWGGGRGGWGKPDLPSGGGTGSNGGNGELPPGEGDLVPVDEEAEQDIGTIFDGLGIGDYIGTITGLYTSCGGPEVSIHYDGIFPTPEGWDDPDTPPINPDYEEGKYWIATTRVPSTNPEVITYHQTCGGAKSAAEGRIGCSPNSPAWQNGCTDGGLSISGYLCGDQLVEAVFGHQLCSNDYNPICDEDAPRMESWPEDGIIDIIFDPDTGTWIQSPLDPDGIPEFSQPIGNLPPLYDIDCNEVNIIPGINGGVIIQNPTDGHFIYIGPDGRIGAAGSSSSVNIYKPRPTQPILLEP